MCGSDSTTTVYQASQIPAWVSTGGEENFNLAKTIAARPYAPYQGARVAGMTPDQLGAIDLMRGATGDWRGLFDTATGMASNAAGASFLDDPQKWMNPFITGVLNPQLEEIVRQSDIARKGINARAVNAGAFGDARHGVAEAELARNTNKLLADTTGQAYAAAYNAGAGQFNLERAAQLQGAGALGQLAGAGQQLTLQDIASLFDIGQRQQAQEQAGLDTAYQDYINQTRWPEEMLNLRLAALSQTPYATTRTQTQPGPNQFAQNVGGIASLLGGAGLLASGLGGLNWFGG